MKRKDLLRTCSNSTRKGDIMESLNIDHEDIYEVTEQDEEKQLLKALNLNNPIVSEEEITIMLRD
jgi:hypothetical protein